MSVLRVLLILLAGLHAMPSLAQSITEPRAYGQDDTSLGSLAPQDESQTTNVSIIIPPSAASSDDKSPNDGRPPAAKRPGQPSAKSSPRSLLPWEPDQFQRFLEAATSERLKHFGHDLFDNPPSTFAPLEDVPVPTDYVIGPGDELQVRLWGTVDLDTQATVDRNGQIRLSKIGVIPVTGIRAAEIEPYLRDKIARLYKNFSISVSMGKLRSMQIYVMGQAKRPGAYVVSSLSTLVSGLFASGGPSASGSMRHIKLVRKEKEITELDLYALMNAGDKSADMRLQPGDVIVIPPAGPRVALLGAYNRPAIYELRQDSETIAQVLAYGGGLPVTALPRMALLERISTERGGKRVVEQINLSTGADRFLLKNGDMLTLLPISLGIDNAVTLRGHVAMPMRYPYRAGMRISDLIPNQEALLTPHYFQSKNDLVGYRPGYLQQRGVQSESHADVAGWRQQPQQDKPDQLSQQTQQSQQDKQTWQAMDKYEMPNRQQQRQAMEINWEYAVIERLNPVTLNTEVIPFNLGKAILEGDPTQNLPLKPGDVVSVFSKKDLPVPHAKDSHMVRLEGEVAVPGLYQALPGETLRELVVRVGGLTPDAYLYGARFYRESVKLEQEKRWEDSLRQLAIDVERTGSRKLQDAPDSAGVSAVAVNIESQRRLVDNLRAIRPQGRIILSIAPESSKIADLPDIPLEEGDRFVVPKKPAFVTVMGQVYSPGSFIYQPNMRMADYLGLAGGPTPQAERDDMHVFHANGTVSSARQTGWTDAGLEGRLMQPGDTIFVPEVLERFSWRKELKDWTAILYQFGLGAAALESLTD